MLSLWKNLKIRRKIRYYIFALTLILTISLVMTAGFLIRGTVSSALLSKGISLGNITAEIVKNGVQYNVAEYIETPLSQVIAGDSDVSFAGVITEDAQGVWQVKAQKKAKNHDNLNAADLLEGLKKKAPTSKGDFLNIPASPGFWLIGKIDLVPNDTLKGGYIVLMMNAKGITRDIRTASLLMSGIGLFMILLGIVSSVLLSNTIVGPINIVASRLDKVSHGMVHGQIVSLDQKDEVGMLTQASNRLVEYFGSLIRIIDDIGKGDLTGKIVAQGEHDEVSVAVNKMVEKLHELVGGVKQTLNQMVTGVAQVASSSDSVSQGAAEQASSIEETSKSMSDISVQTEKNAENSDKANQLAIKCEELAKHGQEQITVTVEAMKDNASFGMQIAKIIKVVDDIAFQTNLLALNAAVEAAHAGKHGMGFAVVAEEVRNLAGRSAKAASETAALIEKSNVKIENGLAITTKTAATFNEIVVQMVKVADIIETIAFANKEQAQRVAQVSQGLAQIDSVTQHNSQNAEGATEVVESLSRQSELLKATLSQFKI